MKTKPAKKPVTNAGLAKVIGELAHLNRLPRADFFKAGVREPVSIGAFTTLASQISFIIAAAEKADPCRAAAMTLFTMLPNSRVGVVDYLARAFVNIGETREKAIKTQLGEWPQSLSGPLGSLLEESENVNRSKPAALTKGIDLRVLTSTQPISVMDSPRNLRGSAVLAPSSRPAPAKRFWRQLQPERLRIGGNI